MNRNASKLCLFAFLGSGKAQRAFLLIGIHHAGDVRRRSRDVHTLEQFSLSESQDVTSSLPAGALTWRHKGVDCGLCNNIRNRRDGRVLCANHHTVLTNDLG